MRARPFLLLVALVAPAVAGCTGGGNGRGPDADNDGLPNSLETSGWIARLITRNGTEERLVRSSPTMPDTDGDGLSDHVEWARALDPANVDSDGDGLLDGKGLHVLAGGELEAAFLEWGLVRDPANFERFIGEAELCPENGGLDPADWNSDKPFRDGIPDGEEVAGWNVTVRGVERHVASSPCRADTDGDALPDDLERDRGTDPTLPDTDGDGTVDSADADPLWNLGLTARVERLRPAAGAAQPLRVQLNLDGKEAAHDARPAADGALAQRLEVSADVSDATASPGHLVATLFLRVTDAAGRVLDFGGGELLEVQHDLMNGRWKSAGREGQGRFESEGPDGAIVVEFRPSRT